MKCIEVPPSAMAETLAQGRIAGAVMNDPEISPAVEAKQVEVFSLVATTRSPRSSCRRLGFQPRIGWRRTRTWRKRFGDAIVAGGVWGMKNPGPAAAILAKYTGSKEATPKCALLPNSTRRKSSRCTTRGYLQDAARSGKRSGFQLER